MISRHIQLRPLKMSSWRRVAVGTWSSPASSEVYGVMEIDARPLIGIMEKLRKDSGEKITVTHVVGAAVGRVLREHPELNVIIRFGKIYRRPQVDIFFQVAVDESGEELSGSVVREADKKSVVEIARALHAGVKGVRAGDPEYKKGKKLFKYISPFLVRPFLRLVGFLLYSLNIFIPFLGIPRDPFGSIMVTSVGMLGIRAGFAPLVPYSRVPCVIVVGQIQDKPVAENGQVIVAPVLTLTATIDHRVIDGVHAGKMAKSLEHFLLHPNLLL